MNDVKCHYCDAASVGRNNQRALRRMFEIPCGVIRYRYYALRGLRYYALRGLLARNVIRFFDENNILPTSESVELIAILSEFMMSGPEWQAPDLDAISMRLENERSQCV